MQLGVKMKVLVAMSGGVDSSFVAAWLKDQGHEVMGVTMKVWQDKERACRTDLEKVENSCCGAEAMGDARSVATTMGFPYYVLNYEDTFKQAVIEHFVSEYLEGRTPNPCVSCNDKVKFDPLMKAAMGLGCDKLATGHYARIEQAADGSFKMLRAKDLGKDQTYFLYRLNQQQLSRLIFPAGDLIKDEVRRRSEEYGLRTAQKAESMDICFVQGEDYGDVVARLRPEALKEGPVLTSAGAELGKHKGIAFYTVGQRKGLGIASEKPMYVVRLDRTKNAVIVGGEEELLSKTAKLKDIHWISGRTPEGPVSAHVKIRSSHPGALATIVGTEIIFTEPQRAITPGQAAVFYVGDECLGGGAIS